MNGCRVALWWILALGVGGCRCGDGAVDPLELGFQVQPNELDFGRVLEGDQKTLPLTLTARTRAAISAEVSVESPFEAPTRIDISGGGEVQLPVVFRAGTEAVSGELRLAVGNKHATVILKGTGVRPPVCTPSAACLISTYVLADDACVETAAADDSACDTGSRCLEQGRCRMGQCLGITRRCDDNNPCTDDACSLDVGCVHTPHVCPVPSAPCQQAKCEPSTGCGQEPAPDLTACGSQDCVEVHFCYSGECKVVPTPEGLPCAPAIACLPEATCHQQMCQRPTEADWLPQWSAPVPGTLTGGISSAEGHLFFSVCGATRASTEDGGMEIPDGGDAGAECGLQSLTGSGFERFLKRYDDDLPREVLAANSWSVLLGRDGGLELRTVASGGLRATVDVDVPREAVVLQRERVLMWADGGIQAWGDGGLQPLVALPWVPSALAAGNALYAWSSDAGVLAALEWLEDGGTFQQQWLIPSVNESALAASGDLAVVGGYSWVYRDGGAGWFDALDAGATAVRGALTSVQASNLDIFVERCVDDAGCVDGGIEVSVEVVDVATQTRRWSAPVVPADGKWRLVGHQLIEGAPGALVVLLREETTAGARAMLVLFAEGKKQAVCRLPAASGAVEQSHFVSGGLVVAAQRPDGRTVVERYSLGLLPVALTGWPSEHGVNGSRADRP